MGSVNFWSVQVHYALSPQVRGASAAPVAYPYHHHPYELGVMVAAITVVVVRK
jgi:hypothetical protein